jgi:transglutaminase-like putative cysteine protease
VNAIARESLYTTLARISGLMLILVCVLFQRRGLIGPLELVFLGLCIGVQETFLRVNVLRRMRAPMMVAYSLMPLGLVLLHANEISSYRGDFVQIVLHTPLPLVLVSVQIMVLYVRESSRLVSVVLVLALFSTVIGLRRQVGDPVWPWLAVIGVVGTLFLMLQHPGMLFHGVYVARRRGPLPPAGRPGGIMRGTFFAVLPMFSTAVLAMSLFLYVTVPRLEAQQPQQTPYEVGTNPGENGNNGGPSDTRRDPLNPRNTPPVEPDKASVSGLSDGVDLGDFGEIKRQQTPALEVKLTAPENVKLQRVYLRAFTYGTFDGTRWAPIDTPVNTFEVPEGNLRSLPNSPDLQGFAYDMRTFRIVLREAGIGAGGQLPLPPEPTTITDFTGPLYYDAVAHTVRAPSAKAGDSYQVVVDQLTLQPDKLVERLADSAPAQSPRPEYLQVPPALRREIERRFNNTEDPKMKLYDRFRSIVARNNGGRAEQRGVYAAAYSIVDMFQNAPDRGGGKAWTYSLDFRPKPGPDAIARFLDIGTEGAERFGHCEYFATAMCMLMRCYGVPARVCAGFFAQGPNDDGIFDVRASAAHAWVEVYFKDWGWLAFDPTPTESAEAASEETPPPTDPDKAEPKSEPGENPELGAAAQGAQAARSDWLQSYDRHAQEEVFGGVREVFGGLGDGISEVLAGFTAWMPDVLPRNPVLRSLLLVLPGVLMLVAVVWRRRRRKKMEARVLEQMGEGGSRRQRGLYFQLLMLLARYGFQKRASETPREFALRVLRRGGNQHEPVMVLTEQYYSLRFGQQSAAETDFRAGLAKYSDALRAFERARRSSSAEPGQAQPG